MKMKLNWRLSKLPSVNELQELVKDKIITQDEAREILFSSETEEDRDKKSLESEIKFLRELVEQLSKRDNARIVEVIREVERPWRRYDWYQPYVVWCSTSGNLTGITTSSNYTLTANTVGGSGGTATINKMSFSDIKTF